MIILICTHDFLKTVQSRIVIYYNTYSCTITVSRPTVIRILILLVLARKHRVRVVGRRSRQPLRIYVEFVRGDFGTVYSRVLTLQPLPIKRPRLTRFRRTRFRPRTDSREYNRTKQRVRFVLSTNDLARRGKNKNKIATLKPTRKGVYIYKGIRFANRTSIRLSLPVPDRPTRRVRVHGTRQFKSHTTVPFSFRFHFRSNPRRSFCRHAIV